MSAAEPGGLWQVRVDARKALFRWLDEHPVLAEDGKPFIWMDGTPIALKVLEIVALLEATEE